jgi:hypothetical protein
MRQTWVHGETGRSIVPDPKATQIGPNSPSNLF